MSPPILALDLYGTLLNPSSISVVLSNHLPPSSPIAAITASWRNHQLQYTWRLTCGGAHLPFRAVTRGSLINALHDHNVPALSDAVVDEIIHTYTDDLALFPDAEKLLAAIAAGEVEALVFSNGDSEMLDGGMETLSGKVARYISVEKTGKYKPAQETYRYLLEQLGREAEPASVVLVSGNPFDVVGAAGVGMGTVWVDRAGNGWGDQLGQPKWVVRSLEEVVHTVLNA